jgi:hypothetical protein
MFSPPQPSGGSVSPKHTWHFSGTHGVPQSSI